MTHFKGPELSFLPDFEDIESAVHFHFMFLNQASTFINNASRWYLRSESHPASQGQPQLTI
jgi:hypothetical protein